MSKKTNSESVKGLVLETDATQEALYIETASIRCASKEKFEDPKCGELGAANLLWLLVNSPHWMLSFERFL